MKVAGSFRGIQTDAFDDTDVYEGMLKERLCFLVQVRLYFAHTRDVVVDYGQESLGTLARYRLVMNQNDCRFPEV